MRKGLMLLPLLLVGCADNTTTLTIRSAEPTGDRQVQQAVQDSAGRMYRLMIQNDAKGFCRFVAPSSIQNLSKRFPRSGMTSMQICQLVSKAALSHYLRDPNQRQALRDSIRKVSTVPVEVEGNQAVMGSSQHHTRFEKVGKTWRPMMPNFGLGESVAPEFQSDQVSV